MLAKTWLLDLSVLVTIAAVLLLLHTPKVSELFHAHVRDRPKRRLLLAAIGFFVTFAVARSMAYAAHRNAGPFHYVYIGGTPIPDPESTTPKSRHPLNTSSAFCLVNKKNKPAT